MNIADRIQNLRKLHGISQEQLADQLGVSRQAVSKWESEQSIPDIEKIIGMSDYFNVTTDYLLKGIEPTASQANEKPNANIFAIIATAFNTMGLIVAIMVWHERQTATATLLGLILMVIGCMVYGIGMFVSSEQTKKNAEKMFATVNSWILLFMPLSMLYNTISQGFRIAPYPILVGSVIRYALFWVAYGTIGVITNLSIRCYLQRSKHHA